MPELPEVETVMRGLQNLIPTLDVIEEVKLSQKQLRFPYPKKFAKSLEGFAVEKLERRSKYLQFVGRDRVLLNHLGMTGNWREAPELSPEEHDHVLIRFKSGLSLVYNDVRRFGYFDFLKRSELADSRWFQHLGPEPLPAENLDVGAVVETMKSRKAAIKTVIMDAKVLVGVGNIYASEALFRAGIRPQRPANKISRERLRVLVESAQQVLGEAIESGGSTIKNFKDSGGSSGYFQTRLQVYGRSGEPCVTCSSELKSEMLMGRNTFWCPKCQS
ncbi:MAG: bifunctional DNA-formamidopyrimidine glycosylase/DNA-(apurinic or apyrimidinic site) lyase [Bdellovibrionales bacterium]|nr:bifunctional DNA-formamidopyrimidine glycosylase/DNA-(apurinic or apyrimidinic site) lyase [Bdellovibrionales bacterium]